MEGTDRRTVPVPAVWPRETAVWGVRTEAIESIRKSTVSEWRIQKLSLENRSSCGVLRSRLRARRKRRPCGLAACGRIRGTAANGPIRRIPLLIWQGYVKAKGRGTYLLG